MSSYNPPYPYYNGITYNGSYFTSNTSGLSKAQANALYLQKTTKNIHFTTVIDTFDYISGI